MDYADDEETLQVDGSSAEPVADIADNNRVLQLTIHRTDKLKSNLYVAHPIVRVTVVDVQTGCYVKKQKKCVSVVCISMESC